MLVWVLQHFGSLLERLELHTSGDSTVFLMARTAIASVTSFLIAIFSGPFAIRWLQKHCPEKINSDSARLNELHAAKGSTPTMGGLFVMGSVVTASLMWGDLTSPLVLLALLGILGFSSLGAYDDWVKLSTSRNGLKAKHKFRIQLLISLVLSVGLYFTQREHSLGLSLVSPIGDFTVPIGIGFIFWSMLVLTGSSNAVNLTDGLDGLATGCTIFAGSAFVALTYLAGHAVMADYFSIPFIPGSGELSVVLGALVGAMLGFLWFNCYPAQVFMGDTGSLPVGALLAFVALVTRQEFLLMIVGGVFVIETLSVIAQVGWFRMTGNRLIACSPLHNHFLFKGQHEIKIVTRFWISSALLAIVAVASLKIR